MIEHRQIANLVASDLAEFALGPGDRVVQGSSVAYDSSIEEIWLALASGATLLVMDDAAARAGPDIVAWLADHRATVFCPPPTLLRSSGCSNPRAALPDLKLLYVGGEALPADIAALWADGRRMVNGYGPTECARSPACAAISCRAARSPSAVRCRACRPSCWTRRWKTWPRVARASCAWAAPGWPVAIAIAPI
jgi:non-ribosomal peptide synthetase component F